MSSRSRPSFSDGEVGSSEDGEKVTKNAPYRKNSDIDSSARLTSSSRTSRPSNRDAYLGDRSANFGGPRSENRRSRSPFRHDRSSHSRSPYRAEKDNSRAKRRREQDHYGNGASDTRRHKAYEDRQHGTSASGGRHRDLERSEYSGKQPRYRDRPGYDRGRGRDRSRSPFRADQAKYPPSFNSARNADNRAQIDGNHTARSELTPAAAHEQADARSSTPPAGQAVPVADRATKARDEVAEPAEPAQNLSEAELIEQRRKKRDAIRKKHASGSGADLLRVTLESNLPTSAATPRPGSSNGSEQHSPPSSANSPATPQDGSSAPGSPADFAAMKDEDLVNPLQVNANAATDEQEQSAADYDPNQDMNEDRPEFKRQDLQESTDVTSSKAAVQPKPVEEFDMFADDDDDMFAANDAPAARSTSKQAKTLDESLLDNWDYPDGHYRIINGELLEGRYAVEQQVGKGTFATVVRARDTNTGNKVAIKIACRNDTMLKAGQREMQFLNRLNERDPEDKRYIIRLLGNFTHKGHLCLVFEGLHMDMRELLKKFGRDVGINLDGVKVYAHQMFQALLHMKSAEVLHADLKPDNILVNEKHTLIKVCDFGTATLQQDAELTPYLVSRFYRAPEVILGMDFDFAIDMWAIGCTLYELYAGRILFNGSDNNNMLRVIQECRGKLPNRLIKRAELADKYFDKSFTFHGLERDKMTGNIVHRPMHFAQGLSGKDIKSRLSGNLSKMTPTMLKEHYAFVDLLDKCLQLDPEKRLKPKDALHHHFFARPSQHAKTKAPTTAPTFRPMTVQHSG